MDKRIYDPVNAMMITRRLFLNIHKRRLSSKPHIKAYKKIRKLHAEIFKNMQDYHESGKFKWETDPNYVSKHPPSIDDYNEITLVNSQFDTTTDVGINAFMDIMIYKAASNMNCIVEEFINNKHYRKPEKIELLQSMLKSRLGLFEIIKKDSEEGYVHIREVFTGREYKTTDIALSYESDDINVYYYMRIITHQGISFNSGIAMPFKKTDPFIQKFITEYIQNYDPQDEFIRFTELYNQYTQNPNEFLIITNH
ncbi:MAG: hypothetical protein FWH37_01335 [Candidatus Bathyarchaeota archaeon]|nr:hypothetical protein [Candidatus Termiticorpusculum sp.]